MEIPFFSTAAFLKVPEIRGNVPLIHRWLDFSLSLSSPPSLFFFFSFFLLLVSGQDCNTFEELSFSLEFILSWIKFKTHSNAKNLHLLLQVLSVSDTVSLLLVPCQA